MSPGRARGAFSPLRGGSWRALAARAPDRVAVRFDYDTGLAHKIAAGADMFVMPSRYEPCGLNQMYSLKYGTVPVVRETGGLADSVRQIDERSMTGDGILFRDFNADGLAWAMNRGLDLYRDRALWHKVIENGMRKDFSWQRQGQRYVELFRQLSA